MLSRLQKRNRQCHLTPTDFQFFYGTAKEVFYAERVAELWQPAWQRATGFLRLIGTLTQDLGMRKGFRAL